MFRKVIYLSSLLLLVKGELLQIKNNGQDELLVSVTGLKDFLLTPGNMVPVTVHDEFSGSITGIPSKAKDIEVPRTRVELTLSPMGDAYDVSVLNGFNIKAKITPLQGRRCKTTTCSADINSLCSLTNQIRNGTETVFGCYNSPFLFKAVCPKAVVTSADVRNVFTCTTDSYLISLG